MMIRTVEDLLSRQINELLQVESQIVHLFPRMAELADNDEVQSFFRKHVKESERHCDRLRECLEILRSHPSHEKSETMVGFVTDGDRLLTEIEEPRLRDLAMVQLAQRLHRLQVTGYELVHRQAEQIRNEKLARTIHKSVDEQNRVEKKLDTMIEQAINRNRLVTAR